ncbi:MAG TPA: beta-ketoacyl-ACP synthase II [Thermomicrobiales bacterium]|nr:beta-ketoacyl-ACP synthase II [Thermomicrobiales bacterium]
MATNGTRRRVVVTGMGVISPLGLTLDENWRALCEGRSGADYITGFDAKGGGFTTYFACEVKGFDPAARMNPKEARRMDRVIQFAVVAAQDAVEHAGLAITPENAERVGVIIGSGIGGLSTLEQQFQVLRERGPKKISPFLIPMMIADMSAGQVSISIGAKGTNFAPVSACATSAHAIGEAAEAIRRGAADAIVAGGSEAAITPIGIGGFGAMTALSTRNDDPQHASRPFDAERDGFVMGEGAAMVVLEDLEHALARGATIWGEVLGYGSTADANHIVQPAPQGEGATRAMRQALDDADLSPDAIQYLNAHGTSTPLNEQLETLAIKAAFGEHAYELPISSTKSMTGHLLGAAGSLESVYCLLAMRHGLIPPTINYEYPDPDCDLDYVPNEPRPATLDYVMTNSLGFGGHNVSLILGRYRS